MTTKISTKINEYVISLWDKKKYIAPREIFLAFANSNIPDSTILQIGEGVALRKSSIAKIEKLEYEFVGRFGKKYNGTREEIYSKIPKDEILAFEKQVERTFQNLNS